MTRTSLDVRLFGTPTVIVDGVEVTPRISRRGVWLLAVLALRAGRPIERGLLAGTLWPDSDDEAALHNLRQTLAGVRRALGPARDAIAAVSPRSLCLQPEFNTSVDVWTFDQACNSKDSTAIDLYRGLLMAGCDEPFAVEAREACRQAFLAAADRFAGTLMARGDYGAAAPLLRRILAEDPYHEISCRSLMVCLTETGKSAAALEVGRTFRSRLRRHLRLDVQSETKSLYRAIRSGAAKQAEAASFGRLPPSLTMLVGRTGEIGEVCSLLDRCRLVTLTGTGGVGKTRLAIAVAEAASERYLDGAWFVDLAPVRDAAGLTQALAGALGIREAPVAEALDTLSSWLSSREPLIVVDNAEHVASAAAGVLERLLTASPGLRVLVTSRQSLGVAGELTWPVPSLALPVVGGHPADSDSVRLFLQRAGRKFCDSELKAVASLCRRLDGLPLAIELAAARAKVFSASDIEARLGDRFPVLVDGARTVARHHTLQASIEWSWDLLADDERSILLRLCAFRGGATLDGLEGVINQKPGGRPLMDVLSSLVDRSLVNTSPGGGRTRFTMLETIRQFGEAKLRELDEFDAASDSHRDYFLAWAEDMKVAAKSGDELPLFERLETDHDNLLAALVWCIARAEPLLEMRLVLALARFWDTHGRLSEGRGHVEAALRRAPSDLPPRMLAEAHLHAGWMATVQRDCTVACQHYECALPAFRAVNDELAIARTLNCLGGAHLYNRDLELATAAFEAARKAHRNLGVVEGIAICCSNLAETALEADDVTTARRHLNAGLAVFPVPNPESPEISGLILANLAVTDFRQGRREEAKTNALQAMRLFRERALLVNLPGALALVAAIAGADERWDVTARLQGAAERLAAEQGMPVWTPAAKLMADASARAKAGLGTRAHDVALAEGRAMLLDDAVKLGVSLGARSTLS